MRQLLLTTGWQLRQRDIHQPLDVDFATDRGWLPTTIPSSVHETLIAADKLQDPFVGLNEEGAQWIGENDWLYRCEFTLDADLFDARTLTLCCDGLDTIATLWLNGIQLFSSDNMFVPQRVDISEVARVGQNELRILFESPVRVGKQREETHGAMRVWNGDASRVYVRKAQYHYGWDWGPTLLTFGPWKPIRIEAYDACISDLACPITLASDLSQAQLQVTIQVEDTGGALIPLGAQHAAHRLIAVLALHAPDGQLIGAASVAIDENQASHTFTIDQPQLWWPHGYGAQPRYTLEVHLEHGQERLDQQTLRLGIRQIDLVQEPVADQPGTSFYFRVNNTPLFCGGANWIPADSFLNRITAERYRALVEQTVQANMVMLRVWGGGIYEDTAFYEACDELGVLVWQDFLFGCGMYPAPDWMQASVRAEATAQIRRLRHHPSLAIWCGNNEDYQIAASDYDITAAPDAESSFPARVIYEQLLPELVQALDPGRMYWPGSPYGGPDGNSLSEGDRHSWDVWHGELAPYQEYIRFMGRFVSEFGMAALPEMATIEAFTTPEERYPGSRTIEHHNKATGGVRRIALYMADNLRPVADLADYIYASQFIQAEAMAYAYRSWRRYWRGEGDYRMGGALVWQINDCWPVTSWALIDYYLRPKAAYYTVKRQLAPLAIGVANSSEGTIAWVVNGTLQAVEAHFELRSWTIEGELVGMERADLTIPPNRAFELGQYGWGGSGAVIYDARLLVAGMVVARDALWPEPFKYLHLPEPTIIMSMENNETGSDTIRLRAIRPAKGVLLSAGDGVIWSDNMIDLMPDDEVVITAQGLADRPIQLRWLQ
jgi:beta-mannosidase